MNHPDHQKILKRFGNHIRSLREARELSLRALADEADVDYSMIHRIEKGKSNPSLIMMITLAEALNLPLSELTDF